MNGQSPQTRKQERQKVTAATAANIEKSVSKFKELAPGRVIETIIEHAQHAATCTLKAHVFHRFVGAGLGFKPSNLSLRSVILTSRVRSFWLVIPLEAGEKHGPRSIGRHPWDHLDLVVQASSCGTSSLRRSCPSLRALSSLWVRPWVSFCIPRMVWLDLKPCGKS